MTTSSLPTSSRPRARIREWSSSQRDFDALRAALIDSTLNYAPDYAHELILSTDASDYATGSRLFQQIDDVEHNIGFWSRTLSVSEQKMAVYFRELLGILEGIRRARIYAFFVAAACADGPAEPDIRRLLVEGADFSSPSRGRRGCQLQN